MSPARASQIVPTALAALALLGATTGCVGPLSHTPTESRWLIQGSEGQGNQGQGNHGQGNGGRASAAPPAALGMDPNVPVRVAIYGDSRDDRRVHRGVVDAIAHAKPDVVLFTGDALGCLPLGHMPDYGGWTYAIPFWWQYHRYYPVAGASSFIPFPALVHESIGSAFLPVRDGHGFNAFLEDTAPLRLYARVPYLFAPGNHDLYHDFDRAETTRLFGTDGHIYTSLDIAGRYRILVLDTGSDLNFDEDPMRPGGAQLKWLDERLTDADAHDLRTIVVMHLPPYSSGAEDGPVPWVRERVVEPIFNKHRIDLVACGHAHAYERIQQRGFKGRIVNYIVTGGGGAPFHHAEERVPGSVAFAAATAHFVMVEMTPAQMKIRMVPVTDPADLPPAWAMAGEAPDEFTIDLAR